MSRRRTLGVGALGLLAIGASIVWPATPRLLWNASASAPIGFYRVDPLAHPVRGLMVAIRLSRPIALFAAERHYLPLGVPLIKPIMGISGDRVCRLADMIFVNGRATGQVRARDHIGRSLPRWRGCVRLRPGVVFVMNGPVRDSFDGRYFGPLPVTAIVGRVTPIWLGRNPLHVLPTTKQETVDDPDR